MKKYIKPAIFIIVFAVIAFAFFKYDLKQYVTQEYISGVVNSYGMFAPVAFMVIYYVVTIFFISAAVFTVLAGLLFGPLWGTLYVIIAATLAAQTAFYIAKFAGRGAISKIGHQGIIGKMTTRIEEQLENGGFKTFFILRCLFLPYMPVSYAAGLIPKAKANDFFWATLITNTIFSPAFVIFGDALTEGPWAILIAVTLVVLVLLVPKAINRFRQKSH